jgi:chorismate synthase
MSHNTFGHLFRVTTWGESHGAAIGCVVDGCPPRIPLSEADIQSYLDKRRPGQSRYTTQRQEPDQVRILSGVFADEAGGEASGEQVTTGTPISLMIENVDQRSKDYSEIRERYRPGHADYTYDAKYGIRDYRGGGRSSARETAMRVAAGAIARKVVPGLVVRGALIRIGEIEIDRRNWDWNEVDNNPFFSPDAAAAKMWAAYLDDVRKSGSSVGAVVEVEAEGVPVGLGAPVYGKLDQEIASALMSINAVKGVEIGNGFEAARIRGEENADEMRTGNDGKPVFLSNNAGGVLGGISSGQPVVARFAVKPTSSILGPVKGVTRGGEDVDLVTKGRHDPCVGIRAVPVGEAMLAIVLADQYLRHRAQTGFTAPTSSAVSS